MSNCESGANSQLKALQARLDRVDDDLMAHYAGISAIVIGLSANPVTAPSVAKVAPMYNMSSIGQTLLKKLKSMLPGVDQFKNLQHIDSAALIDGMAAKLEDTAVSMAATAANQAISTAEAHAFAMTAQIDAMATQALAAAAVAKALAEKADAVSKNDTPENIAKAQAKVEIANAAAGVAAIALEKSTGLLSEAADLKNKAEAVLGLLNGYIGTCSDIAKCRTRTQILTP